jgi:hypothetical protein
MHYTKVMRPDPQTPQSHTSYRSARRAFIAACEKAHVETVSRLHPARAPDGKPLFMDSAAMGPRHAAKAVLVAAYDAPGSEILIALLGSALPPDAQLVLVHALDPAAFAGVRSDPAWPAAMLGAEAAEDLSHTRELAVLPLGRRDETLKPALQARLPRAQITVLPQVSTAAKAWKEIAAFFAAH